MIKCTKVGQKLSVTAVARLSQVEGLLKLATEQKHSQTWKWYNDGRKTFFVYVGSQKSQNTAV